MGRSLRIKIQLDVKLPLKRVIFLKAGSKGEDRWIPITYEKLPDFCYGRGRLGHTIKECEDQINSAESELLYGPLLREPLRLKIEERGNFSASLQGRERGRGTYGGRGRWQPNVDEEEDVGTFANQQQSEKPDMEENHRPPPPHVAEDESVTVEKGKATDKNSNLERDPNLELGRKIAGGISGERITMNEENIINVLKESKCEGGAGLKECSDEGFENISGSLMSNSNMEIDPSINEVVGGSLDLVNKGQNEDGQNEFGLDNGIKFQDKVKAKGWKRIIRDNKVTSNNSQKASIVQMVCGGKHRTEFDSEVPRKKKVVIVGNETNARSVEAASQPRRAQ